MSGLSLGRAVGEYAVIPEQVRVAGRHQGRESAQELLRSEDQLSRASRSRPGSAQAVDHLSIRPHRQTSLRDRTAQSIATEMLECFSVLGPH